MGGIGCWSIQSGFPLNITLGGNQGSNGLPNATNVPMYNGNVSYIDSANRRFTVNGFSSPAVGAWGNYDR